MGTASPLRPTGVLPLENTASVTRKMPLCGYFGNWPVHDITPAFSSVYIALPEPWDACMMSMYLLEKTLLLKHFILWLFIFFSGVFSNAFIFQGDPTSTHNISLLWRTFIIEGPSSYYCDVFQASNFSNYTTLPIIQPSNFPTFQLDDEVFYFHI